jgi:hypothetical protein
MSISSVVNIVLTVLIIAGCYYLANRVIRNSQQHEQSVMNIGGDVYVTILSMKQNGLFLNNNPVIEMSLRIEDPNAKETWMLEKYNETVLLIALDAYQVGHKYQAKIDDKKNIIFVKDNSGKPLPVEQ